MENFQNIKKVLEIPMQFQVLLLIARGGGFSNTHTDTF